MFDGVGVLVGVGVFVGVCVWQLPLPQAASKTVSQSPHEPAGTAQKTPQSQQSFACGGGVCVGVSVGVAVQAGLTSAGQVGEDPSQVSAMSQPPATGRHTVPAVSTWQSEPQHPPGGSQFSPASTSTIELPQTAAKTRGQVAKPRTATSAN